MYQYRHKKDRKIENAHRWYFCRIADRVEGNPLLQAAKWSIPPATSRIPAREKFENRPCP